MTTEQQKITLIDSTKIKQTLKFILSSSFALTRTFLVKTYFIIFLKVTNQ